MMFFKRNAPTVVDYDKTKSELLKLGWLVEIYDVESNKSIYDITNLGYQYYFAICMKVNRIQIFSGPTLAEGQSTAYIDDDIDLTEEGYLVDGIDCEKLTPKAAEYLYVLTDLHGKEITIKNQNAKTVKSGSANKVGKYTSMFMRGMKKLSESAQDYDKTSTTSTRNAWGKKKKKFFPQKKFRLLKEKSDIINENPISKRKEKNTRILLNQNFRVVLTLRTSAIK